MRILIISDIHANLTALQTVLNAAGPIDAAWCLGDLVGYGPDPNECIQTMRTLSNLTCILGNHDAAVLERLDIQAFNQEARQAIEWTQATIDPEGIAFLKELPESRVINQVTLAHGSPRHPVWEYLLDAYTATRSFDSFDTDFCFVGHTHLPAIFHLGNDGQIAKLLIPEPDKKITLSPRVIINPGSVGQPRDRDPRAAYAIFTPEESTWEYHRVLYDIGSVQARMKAAGLPDKHIHRISNGW
jgi:predicted phosphodiesterase